MVRKKVFIVNLVLLATLCTACASSSSHKIPYRAKEVRVATPENPVPGTVSDFWEEPMYDDVDVPAALDPEGAYYRPEHKEMVEAYPGRHQQMQFPDGETKEKVFKGDSRGAQ